jgi:hypothetical protein
LFMGTILAPRTRDVTRTPEFGRQICCRATVPNNDTGMRYPRSDH